MGYLAVILCLLPIVVGLLASIGKKSSPTTTFHVNEMPDGEKYVRTDVEIPQYDGSLADKVDGRFTNVFKNPWEDIL